MMGELVIKVDSRTDPVDLYTDRDIVAGNGCLVRLSAPYAAELDTEAAIKLAMLMLKEEPGLTTKELGERLGKEGFELSPYRLRIVSRCAHDRMGLKTKLGRPKK